MGDVQIDGQSRFGPCQEINELHALLRCWSRSLLLAGIALRNHCRRPHPEYGSAPLGPILTRRLDEDIYLRLHRAEFRNCSSPAHFHRAIIDGNSIGAAL